MSSSSWVPLHSSLMEVFLLEKKNKKKAFKADGQTRLKGFGHFVLKFLLSLSLDRDRGKGGNQGFPCPSKSEAWPLFD